MKIIKILFSIIMEHELLKNEVALSRFRHIFLHDVFYSSNSRNKKTGLYQRSYFLLQKRGPNYKQKVQ